MEAVPPPGIVHAKPVAAGTLEAVRLMFVVVQVSVEVPELFVIVAIGTPAFCEIVMF